MYSSYISVFVFEEEGDREEVSHWERDVAPELLTGPSSGFHLMTLHATILLSLSLSLCLSLRHCAYSSLPQSP